MRKYKHVGYYNHIQDIIDLFPNHILKGDEAQLIVNYQKAGFGAFHKTDGDEIEDEKEFDGDIENGTGVKSPDGKYIVTFCYGNVKLLRNGDENHGYYIDIWEEFAEIYEEGENEFSGMSNEDILRLASSLSETLKDVIAEIKRRGIL